MVCVFCANGRLACHRLERSRRVDDEVPGCVQTRRFAKPVCRIRMDTSSRDCRGRLSRGSAVLKPEIALNQASLKLGVGDVGTMLVVCRDWRRLLLSHNLLWEEFTRDLFPNLCALPAAVTPTGRAGFLRRLRLLRSFDFPVRAPRWPSALMGTRPLPKALIFLLDLTFRGVRILSDSAVVRLDEHGGVVACAEPKPQLGRSRFQIVEDWDAWNGELNLVEREDASLGDTCAPCFTDEARIEVQLAGEKKMQAVEDLYAEWERASTCRGEDGNVDLHVTLSVVAVEHGDSSWQRVPPVVLLHEPHSFFAYEGCESQLTFRTDVEEAFLTRPRFPPPSHSCFEGEARAEKFWRGQDARYAGSKLPFDPCIDINVSRRCENVCDGEATIMRINNGFFEIPAFQRFANDEVGVCSIAAELHFQAGESDLDFTTEVLPDLLRVLHNNVAK